MPAPRARGDPGAEHLVVAVLDAEGVTEADYFDDWPEAAQTYFGAEKFGRDLAYDFTTVPAPTGGIFVFSKPLTGRPQARW